ncbi:MBL fold metallo-hydrolase [Clostridium sp. SHJSY1]|uniref:ComEC/Rec2 family competence protein n=1 Tax=Clostridium sp. SHJSY1 TaxID=2942483 RepID=UPI00287600F7|nr:ComEC/Rec2 family competence protein [Clostridium sp. SHJSY1]MDS0524734.1 MBL fold metallo-hydrolase [Clostridium sp. SHJSY1]
MKKKIFILIYILFIPMTAICCEHDKINLENLSQNINVHFINVGQGDSILIQVNNKNLLIDSGPKDSKKNIINYLDNLNIKKIDFLLATHPHEDHIGNMSEIIKKYDIKTFYSPKVISTTKSFESMIDALKSKNLKINILKAGSSSIDLGENTSVSIFSPNKDKYMSGNTENLNNYSPVILIRFGKNKFLFTGDAEKDVEKEILSSNIDIKADILKLGHHGSSTSTSEEFLNAVNPSIGVISVGEDNSYGHPHKEVLNLLNSKKIKILRTDIDGDIILSSDGKNIFQVN